MVDLSKVQTLDCQNIGSGLGLFANNTGTTNEVLGFKTLIGGPGIVLNSDDQTVTIEYVGMGNGGAIPFSQIIGTPDRITPLGLLYGTPDNRLDFVSAPSRSGTVLTYNGSGFSWTDIPLGTVTSVGLIGSDRIDVSGAAITGSGQFQLDLKPTGVIAGSYGGQGAVLIDVDQFGRVSKVQNGPSNSFKLDSLGSGQSLVSGANSIKSLITHGNISLSADDNQIYLSSSAVTSVGLNSGTLDVGTPVTQAGSIGVELRKTGVQAGTYNCPTLLVDDFGRITAAMSNQIEVPSARSIGSGASVFTGKSGSEMLFRSIKTSGGVYVSMSDEEITIGADVGLTHAVLQGNGIEISGGTLTAASPTALFSLTQVCEHAQGSYQRPSLTVGPDGRITDIRESETLQQISLKGGSATIVTGGPNYQIDLRPTGMLAGKYTVASITLDDYGRVIATEAPKSQTAPSIGFQGDAKGEGVLGERINIALAETGVLAGTYINPTLTIDTKGRVLAVSQSIAPNVSTTTIASGVAPGTYENATLTIDATGRVTHASSSTSSILPRNGKAGEYLMTTKAGPVWTAPRSKIIPPDLPASTCWRLEVTALDGSGLMGIKDIEFRSEVGGAALPLSGTVLCTDPGWGEHKPENAFRNTGWYVSTAQFGPTGNSTIGFQFADAVTVREFAITAGEANTFAPTKIEIQYQRGEQWIKAWSVTTDPWPETATRVFSSAGAPADESFRTLSDTPSSFIGQALSVVRVRQDETGLEFIRVPRRSGRTDERPDYHDGDDIGKTFFDTSLNKPLWWTGSMWVNAIGEQE